MTRYQWSHILSRSEKTWANQTDYGFRTGNDGELSADSEPMCLFSKNQALVTLFKEAMMNEMALLDVTGKSRKTDQEREKNMKTDSYTAI
jgi:hypothetical protein